MNVLSVEQARQELLEKIQLADQLKTKAIETRARVDFPFFVTEVFSKSFPAFIGGPYVVSVARFLDSSKRTARVSAKDHFKSTSIYARFMFRLFQARDRDLEAHYFSYKEEMAGYHIGKIKNLIKHNPYFADCHDLKPLAETVGAWSWDGEKHKTTLDPQSLLAFKRGLHADWIAVDDPFQDPENKLEPTVVLKINHIFKTQILDIPKSDGELHVVGTPQTPQDFFFDQSVMRRFTVVVQPAIVSEVRREALWPEHMDFDELIARRDERGPKVFAQEFLCSPVYTEDAWLEEEDVKAAINPELVNYNPLKMPEGTTFAGDVTAGWDLGKKRHPSHVAVFETSGGRSQEIASVWMDGWDYTSKSGEFDPQHPTQFEYVKLLCEALGVDKLRYDATRGELEGLKDAGKIPPEWEGVVFTKKQMVAMATPLSDRFTQRTVELIDDPRQHNQLLAVNNSLQAVESPQGHGDSFWSVCLALPEKEESQEAFVVFGD